MSDASLVYDILARDKASGTLARAGANVRAAGIASKAGTVAMAAGFASASAWAVALGAAVRPAVGAIALVPGVAFAAAAAVGALAFASKGMGAAWKAATTATSGGGGSAARSAKAVAAAQREVRHATLALADAQRDELRAQQAINRAREEATEKLEDMARAVIGARLDEESATLAVTEAARRLAESRNTGDPIDIRRAELAYRESLHTLEEVRDRTADLVAENERAQAAGVEGSEEVQGATERYEESVRQTAAAVERLAVANENLADAGESAGGGVDKAAEALAKLSPNARAVILTLLSLRGVWGQVRRDLSDATWANVAGDIRAVSDRYLPVARRELIAVGAGWNVAIRASLGMFRSAKAVENVRTILANTAPMVALLGQAFAHVMSALLDVGAAGSTWLPRLAQYALDLSTRFERFIAAARESGKLDQWIGRGLTTIRQLLSITWNLGRAINAVFDAGQVGGLLASLDSGTAKMAAWLESAEGQARVAQILEVLRGVLTSVVDLVSGAATGSEALGGAWATVSATGTVFGHVMQALASTMQVIAPLLPVILALFLLQKAGIGPSTVLLLIKVRALMAHSAALRANTAALLAANGAQTANTASTVVNTGAQNAGALSRMRAVAATVAHRVATIASTVATRAAAAGQWLLNASFYGFPLVWIIAAIVALVAGFVLLYTKCEWFRDGINAIFGFIVDAAKLWWRVFSGFWTMVGGWFVSLFKTWWNLFTGFWSMVYRGVTDGWNWVTSRVGALVSWVGGLPGRLAAAGRGMWDWITTGFRNAINGVISRWNSLSFRLPSISIPGLGTVFGGFTLSTPNLPYLDVGGDIRRTGLAVVHAGERVVPAAQVERLPSGGRGQGGVARMEVRGDGAVAGLIRTLIRKGDIVIYDSTGARVTV